MTPEPAEHLAASFNLSAETQTNETLAGLPARRGLLLFADCRHQPIQLLMCADIRRTARARLVRQSHPSARKADISSLCKIIYYTPQDSEFACRRLYHRLCRVFFEDQYDDLVSLPRPCFVKLDRQAALPYFSVTETPAWKNDDDEIFGPFITRKNAATFAGALNKAFDLCRNPESLSLGRCENCVYLQMKTCTGPCRDQKMPAWYLQAVNEATDAAAGNHETYLRQKEDQMRHAAVRLEYETARRIRDQIECLKELENPEFRRIRPLRQFCWLHIDRLAGAEKTPVFCVFLITANDVIELESFTTEQVDLCLKKLSSIAIQPAQKSTRNMKDHLAEICLFLYRNRKPGLWLDCSAGRFPNADKLRHLLQQTFQANKNKR
jgi:excinuclease UvrABC nuclease subunit